MSDIQLPQPGRISMSLTEALARRHCSRNFRAEGLSAEELSTILWSAQGVNRENGRRTAPSAHDVREILCYVLTAEGTFIYDPDTNTLKDTGLGDQRAASGNQAFVATCPVNLVYVADYTRCGALNANRVDRCISLDAGMITQNVCLACAGMGLATVMRANFHLTKLACALNLTQDQMPVLTQSIGYPAEG